MRWHLSLGLLCLACPAVAHDQTPVRSLLEMRQQNVVVQQWDTSCGAAALATLLKYQHGLAVSEKQIAEAMLRRGDPLNVKLRGGFSLLDLKRYADAQGLEGAGYLQLGLDDLIDPAFGNRTMDVEAFRSAWNGNIGFIVRRRDGIAPPNHLKQQPTDTLRSTDAAVRSALR